MAVDIRIGDVFEELAKIPDESINCVVTSPPYWGLRDYGIDGQIGLEPTLQGYIASIVRVFDELKRVLAKDGTAWLNCGDSYCSVGGLHDGREDNQRGVGAKAIWRNGSGRADGIVDERGQRNRNGTRAAGFKPKDLCMVPNRLAIALQDAGWWVRSEIIWSKPNPMPESVTDRPSTAHEKVWLLTKSQRYFYDAEAVRLGLAESSIQRLQQNVDAQAGSTRANGGAKTNGPMRAVGGKQRGHGRRHDGFNDRWDKMTKAEQQRNGRNLRNVWNIATKPFKEAHFATFPPELPETCIKAGCPRGGMVLDPFGGAGTTGLIADRLQRNAILIELNPEYAEIARKRIDADRGDALDLMETVAQPEQISIFQDTVEEDQR